MTDHAYGTTLDDGFKARYRANDLGATVKNLHQVREKWRKVVRDCGRYPTFKGS